MSATLDDLVNSYLYPESFPNEEEARTMVVQNHVSQMTMFGLRAGVEYYPTQDDDRGTRKGFIEDIVKHNQLDLQMERIWQIHICKGEQLVYFRPNKKATYDIYFYERGQYRVYYDRDGEIERAIVIYPFNKVGKTDNWKKESWIKLILTKDLVYQEEYESRPSFDSEIQTPNRQTFKNSLGFIPVVVIKNNSKGKGQPGTGDFEPFRSQIEAHNADVVAIQENLAFFGHPILVSTRSPSELQEAGGWGSRNLNRANTVAANSGWYGNNSFSTRKGDPRRGGMTSKGFRLKQVIGNVGADERFAFITPDPVSPDQFNHVQQEREAIHFALGGIDERGIHASATAYEMKTVYGKVATTAKKKAVAIYTHGICKVLEKILAIEEDLFLRSLTIALGRDPNTEPVSVEEFNAMMQAGTPLPEGVFGLPPLGKRTIEWRWKGSVFEDSPDDLQKKSIVTRNLQELGVRSLDALTFLFPEKTEKEKIGMLSGGYPFRYLNAVAGTTQQLLGIYQNLLQLPDQANPGLPLSASLPVVPMIQRSLETIFNELGYVRPIEPATPTDNPFPTGSSAYDDYIAGLSSASPDAEPTTGANGANGSVPAATNLSDPAILEYLTGTKYGVSTNPGINPAYNYTPLQATGIYPNATILGTLGTGAGSPSDGLSGGAGVYAGGNSIRPEYLAGLPVPGSDVGQSTTGDGSGSLPELQRFSPGLRDSLAPVPPDLSATTATQLFPTYTQFKQQRNSRTGSKPKSKSKSKSTRK
jgi:hypothetical protein